MGENHPCYGVTGEDHPAYGTTPTFKKVYVEETDRYVDSEWEREIDVLLHNSGVRYEYEPRTFGFSSWTYTPDFIAGETVIEVKGHDWGSAVERAARFMREYPEYHYVIVGNENVPCHVHFAYRDREKVLDIL